MKKTLVPLIAIVCSLFATLLTIRSQEGEKPGKLQVKHYPNDYFYLQRSYPDTSFDIKAYTNAIKNAHKQQSAASRSIDAFTGDWTVEGPGNIGARINTIATHPTNENIIYVGFSGGGVWKTTDFGQNWEPIFDDQPFLAIGDIALDPDNPDIVYVGTGDPNISSYVALGDGIYKSEDGGQSWTHLGLENQRIISEIIIDPSNSNTIYASAMGLPFEPNPERGLYKSTDGGNSWEQILFISEQAGVCDIMINPQNPQILYAAGWDRIRNSFESIISGPGAKIYKTIDGGDNWEMLEGGLPQDDQGRIGLAMYRGNPDVIFAEYVGTNSQLFGIYKSTDGGANWSEIPTGDNTGLNQSALGGFGWYFAKVRVNPNNVDDIILLGVDLWRTTNSGQSWELASPPWWYYDVHADKHDLVFGNAGNSYDFLLATDGGLYANFGGPEDYLDMENIPTCQFYRVAYNPHEPTLYYGGMQDNGSSGGNAAVINEWPRIWGGDGFQMAFHPDNPNIVLAETQRGNIWISADGGSYFEYASTVLDGDDRVNWDMPYMLSHHDPDIVYTGTYRAHRGLIDPSFPDINWTPISEDLTDGVVTEARYHTISTLHESPLVQGLLYYGTSDGNVQRTDDGGTNWENISAGLPDRYITDVKASPRFEDYVYVTVSGYRSNEFTPRVFRSKDRGANWEDISGNLPDAAVNDVYILPSKNDSVIFIASDVGVYGTIDAGTHWERLGANMPFVPVYDLEINLAQNTLMAGTHARSIMTYPLDSIMFPVEDSTVINVKAPPVKAHQLDIFPSPAENNVNIAFQHTEGQGVYELVVVDMSGRLVHQSEGNALGKEVVELNIADWAKGPYVVKVKTRHVVRMGRFVKR